MLPAKVLPALLFACNFLNTLSSTIEHASRFSKRCLVTVLLVFGISNTTLAAESTASKYIHLINIDGSTDTHYFAAADSENATSSVGWGPTFCSSAAWAYTRDLNSQKDVLAVALAAKTAGQKVVFIGTCDSDPNYFRVTGIQFN